jgi:oligopeptide transport system ATP-binding protein
VTAPILSLRDVTVRYGDVKAIDGLSLDLHRGETLGLVGESGCGKTSVARSIVGLAARASGTMLVDGMDSRALTGRRPLSSRVQLLFQDPLASLSPRLRIRTLLAEPLRIAGLFSARNWAEVEALAADIGLGPQILDRYPHQLSGGQGRRVALVRALAVKPAILVADEPTAGLDLSVQGDLLNLLQALKQRFGLSYLFISHNLNVVGRVTNRIAVMYLGKIVEEGPTIQIFSRPAHPYTAALLSSNLVINPTRRGKRILLAGELPNPHAPPPGCRFHQRCPIARSLCSEVPPPLAAHGNDWNVACHFPLAQTTPVARKAMMPYDQSSGI